jgi:glycosyltransferase involved in cell wall biosynthesis
MAAGYRSRIHISVVIPTLNEEQNIPRLLPAIARQLKGAGYEIIVVDGGSNDRTAELAGRYGARVLYYAGGKGGALAMGLRTARGDILISMDADLSHRPGELRLLISGIEAGYDVCMGSRFICGGGTDDMPWIRKAGNKFFVFLVNSIFHSRYSDLCYGYRSFRRSVLPRLRLREKGFGIETEISINAVKAGLRIIEVPSTEKKRMSGEAKLRTFRDGYAILRTILKNVGR